MIPQHHKDIVHKEVRNFFMNRAVHPYSDFESIVDNIYDNSIVLQEVAEEVWIDMSRSLGLVHKGYNQLMEDFDYDGSASDYVKDLISVEMTKEEYLLTR